LKRGHAASPDVTDGLGTSFGTNFQVETNVEPGSTDGLGGDAESGRMSTHSAAPPIRHVFLGYATLAIQFLRLAENSCDELVARDNATVAIMDGTSPIDFHTYEQMTRWSDTQIANPILFSYLHGIELMLKAFLAQAGRLPTKKAHKLTQLLALFLEDHGDSKLATLLRQCVLEFEPYSPLACFLSQNGESIDSWYETLKYPSTNSGKALSRMALQYGGEAQVPFWAEVGVAAKKLRLAGVHYAREKGIAT
jgi:hypothetical protein